MELYCVLISLPKMALSDLYTMEVAAICAAGLCVIDYLPRSISARRGKRSEVVVKMLLLAVEVEAQEGLLLIGLARRFGCRSETCMLS